MKRNFQSTMLWVLLIVGFLVIYQALPSGERHQKFDFGQFKQLVNEQGIAQLVIDGTSIEGRLKEGNTPFRVDGKITESLHNQLADAAAADKNFKLTYRPEEKDSFFQTILISWLPMLALFVIFFLFMRQLQSGGGKAMSFGKSKAKLLSDTSKRVTFDDVAGVEEAKEELQEIIHFLRDPKRFTRLGGRIPKGVLLMGPPGTGKTLLARGVAGEAGVPFFSISGSDFVEMFVGVGASRVRDLFEQGKKNAPCIIFIDEIDAVGRHRGAGLGGGHDEREQTLNQLLVEMDGFESNEGVILIAATNRPDVLDPALLRPGRFDRRVVVNRPDVRGREEILKVHIAKVRMGRDVDPEVIARGTPGFSGADLENLVNEAALLAARRARDVVTMADFESAKDKVLMGTERRSMIISDSEKRTTAYHEAGHAIVACLTPGADPIHKVTIIPRGRALGVTQQLPAEDRLSMTQDYAEGRIAILMGGRVAEEIIFDEITSGAGQDIVMATSTARSMVCEWGMSTRMGPLAFGKKDEQIFLGREINQSRDYSESTAIAIDEEVRRIVMEGYEKAQTLLKSNLPILTAMAEALLERETLEASDVALLMAGDPLPPIVEEPNSDTEIREPKSVYVTKQKPSTSPIVGVPESGAEGV
ncbi:MAG: ATP-dependent zinc metalloprotease FtsH [Bradymonadia bacterium]